MRLLRLNAHDAVCRNDGVGEILGRDKAGVLVGQIVVEDPTGPSAQASDVDRYLVLDDLRP